MSILPANRYHSENHGTFRPQLTSLIDVMTILLVFLIKSFSVEGSIVTPAHECSLPVSTSTISPRMRCSVVLSPSALFLDGEMITSLKSLSQHDSLCVVPLLISLKSRYTKKPEQPKLPELMIQCDRNVAYAFLKKVMYTCSKAGFSDFSVLVLQEE